MISRVTRDIRRIDWPRVALIAAIVTTTVFLFREGELIDAAQLTAGASKGLIDSAAWQVVAEARWQASNAKR